MLRIRFDASEPDTDSFLKHISLFHTKNNIYSIHPHTFRVSTRLSTKPAQGCITMVTFGDTINWEPYTRQNDLLFFKCVIIKNVPDNESFSQQLISYDNECKEHNAYMIIMHKTPTESKDETYAKLFNYFHFLKKIPV